MTQSPWGASPRDWNLFDLGLGLTDDLLPVVSNPGAKVSEKSKMKGVGKTPSLYNRDREVVGISQWTMHIATEGDIKRWAREADYGICVQTRHLRALDIDVDDKEKSDAIKQFISDFFTSFGLRAPPVRYRQNSGKCLCVFLLDGAFSKRIVQTDGGAVEFLATGQQFIACGTHPSGVRYVWSGLERGPDSLSAGLFEELWAALCDTFGIAEGISQGNSSRKRGEDLGVDDPVVAQLDILGEGRDGQLYIECPWSFAHTSDTGLGQTAYFPKGTNGYQHGHFHCLHASCAKRTDQEFRDALKCDAFVVDDEFSVVSTAAGAGEKSGKPPKKRIEQESQASSSGGGDDGEPGDEDTDFDELTASGDDGEPAPLPSLIRDSKSRPEAVVVNITAMLERPDVVGINIRHDEFRDEIMMSTVRDPKGWRRFTDTDYTKLRRLFDKLGFKPVSREMMRDCVQLVARENRFDSAVEWLTGLKWDGVKRVDRFMVSYLGAPDDEYSVAVSRYLWTAMAGRCLEAGIKADMAPILVGPQNLGKSSIINALAPSEECFVEISLNAKEEDLARLMRGALVGELAELKGLASRDLESIKAFITRRFEKWVPKFQEFSNTYGRRVIFIGSSNPDEFLADETGNRRWLPIRVSKGSIPEVTRDRDQLWAEARELFKDVGVAWQDAYRLAQSEHEGYMISDAWEDAVRDWLAQTDGMDGAGGPGGIANGDAESLRLVDVARGAMGVDPGKFGRREQLRLAATLMKLGYEKVNRRINGTLSKVWTKKLKP